MSKQKRVGKFGLKIREHEGILFFLLFVFLLAGCATLEPGDIPPPALWEEPAPFEAQLAVDIFQFRIDIVREQKTEPGSLTNILPNGEATYKASSDLVPQHYLGLSIGNGVFIDINGNIGIDIVRLFGLDRAASFRLTRTRRGSNDAAEEFSRDGAAATIKPGGWGSGDITCKISREGVSLAASAIFGADQIKREEDGFSFVPSGLFSNMRGSSIRQKENIFISSTGYRMEYMGPDRISLNASHEIIREKDKILINGRGRTIATIVRAGSRYVVMYSESQGSWVEKKGDTISVFETGSLTEYKVETGETEVQPHRTRKIKRPGAKAGKSGKSQPKQTG